MLRARDGQARVARGEAQGDLVPDGGHELVGEAAHARLVGLVLEEGFGFAPDEVVGAFHEATLELDDRCDWRGGEEGEGERLEEGVEGGGAGGGEEGEELEGEEGGTVGGFGKGGARWMRLARGREGEKRRERREKG
jgi:hypothetical protein